MRHKAILIANWSYDEEKGFSPLDGPVRDVAALEKSLTHDQHGLFDPEDITKIEDESTGEIRVKLGEFLRGAKSDDSLLIYFSGHGQPVKDDLVLCTKDTDKKLPRAQGVEVSYINKSLPETRSEQTIVVLDCCYAGRGVKGTAMLNLSFAQNLYCLASSGAFEVTPDAKSKGEPSPFTAKLAELLVDDKIIADRSGAVSVDAIWDKLKELDPKPYRTAVGKSNLIIAKRGEIKDQDDVLLDPLDWIIDEPKVHQVDLRITSKSIESKWGEHFETCERLDDVLVGVMSRTMQLIDGVGRLVEKDNASQWNDVVDKSWRGLGAILMRSTLPKALSDHIATTIDQRGNDEIIRITIQSDDKVHDRCPWEAMYAGEDGAFATSEFLSLTEGVIVERVCKVTRPFKKGPGNKLVPYAIWAAELSEQDTKVSQQIILELDNRRSDLNVKGNPSIFQGRECSWPQFQSMGEPRFLVLTLPIRRQPDGEIQLGFNRGDKVDWKRSADVVLRLERWNRPLECVILETVASHPSFNPYCATIEFSRQLTDRGFGPVVYLCHPPGVEAYPKDGRNVPITFTGQLVSALFRNKDLLNAVHHARSTALRLKPSIRKSFGFPGYYRPESQRSDRESGARTSQRTEGPTEADKQRTTKTATGAHHLPKRGGQNG